MTQILHALAPPVEVVGGGLPLRHAHLLAAPPIGPEQTPSHAVEGMGRRLGTPGLARICLGGPHPVSGAGRAEGVHDPPQCDRVLDEPGSRLGVAPTEVVLECLERRPFEVGREPAADGRNRRHEDRRVPHRPDQTCGVPQQLVLASIPRLTQLVADHPEHGPQPLHRLARLVDRHIDVRSGQQTADRPVDLLEAQTPEPIGQPLRLAQLEALGHGGKESDGGWNG